MISGCTVTQETLDTITSIWNDKSSSLNWSVPFVLPVWLKVWWQNFGSEARPYLLVVRKDEKVIGIAPLIQKDSLVSLLGSANVCDYLDFVIVPGMEKDFFNTLLDYLRQKGINRLELGPVRPDSTVLTHMVNIAKERGYEISTQQEDVTLEVDLPATWDEYRENKMNSKQRHEVERKMRRLYESGKVGYRFIKDEAEVPGAMDTFLKMFVESREDKAEFLTEQMNAYLRSLAGAMAEAGLLRLGVLELDNLPMAMIMCFDYSDCMYLYNSGYDPQYSSLSVGQLSKVLCIKESIEEGKKRFDFLKGNEVYKYRLGGKEVPIFRSRIKMG